MLSLAFLALATLSSHAAATFGADAIPPATVIAPQTDRFVRHSEGSAVELTPGGRILLAWSRFTAVSGREPNDNSPGTIVMAHSDDGGRTWSEPRDLPVGEARVNIMQASMVKLEDRLLLLFSARDGSTNGKFVIESRDGGQTWSPRRRITPEGGLYTGSNDRAIVLRTGRIVLPCHVVVDRKTSDMAPVMVWSDDKGTSWRVGAPLSHQPQPDEDRHILKLSEPTVVERRDGSLFLLCRSTRGRLFAATSADGGETWSPLVPSDIPSKTAPPFMRKLADGRVVLLTNPPGSDEVGKASYGVSVRHTLAMVISDDDGRTWSNPTTIAHDGKNGYCYPAVLELSGRGELLVFCSRSPRVISPCALVCIRVPLPPKGTQGQQP